MLLGSVPDLPRIYLFFLLYNGEWRTYTSNTRPYGLATTQVQLYTGLILRLQMSDLGIK